MKRFDEFSSHLNVLKRAPHEDLNNEFIISGIIDKFFIQFELSWKVLKQLLIYEGDSLGKTGSPRDIIKTAYVRYGFIDEETWLAMLKERNDTAHIYNEEAAFLLAKKIIEKYIDEFERFRHGVLELYADILPNIK